MQHWITKLKRTDGQALVITALSFSVLLGFAVLAVDTGVLFRAKRKMQTAADAAAVAGALDYLYKGDVTSATNAAKAAASANGYTDGSGSIQITVSVPPVDGPNKGNSSFVEVITQGPANTLFMSVLGKSTIQVGSRAVAGTPTAGQACIWLMASSGTALTLQGSYNVQATGCGVYVNSPDSNALSVTGNGGTLNAKFLDVVGSSTSNHATYPTTPTLGAAPRKNPWGNITGPTPTNGQCTTVDTTTTTLTGAVTGPGFGSSICYTQPITIQDATLGTGSVTTNSSTGQQQLTTTTAAGTFVFENGVTLKGTDTVYSGTLDVYSGTFTQSSTNVLNISAPTSGTYNSIALMQPSTNANTMQVQFGASGQIFDGYIYAPGAPLSLHDSGGGVTSAGVVGLSMANQTSQLTIPSYDAAHPSTTRNRVVTLVE